MRRSNRSSELSNEPRRPGGRWGAERGSATLEFVTIGMLLLVPVTYLVLAVAAIQAAAMGAEGAARQAARVFVLAPDIGAAEAAAQRAVEATLADYGIERASASLTIACASPPSCLVRGSAVTATVTVQVTLPLVPAVLEVAVPVQIPVEAQATQRVSRFWGSG